MLSKLNKSNQIHQTLRSGGFLILLFFCASLHIIAQTDKKEEEMPRDERGKYVHYEVIEKSPVPVDSLKYRALAFFNKKKFSAVKQQDDQTEADGKLVINKTAFVLAHPSGEVLYHFVFEVKEGKYRFWLTDFLFVPYKRDRYGNFVASTVKGIPLETDPGKLNAAEWASYVEATAKYASAFGAEFKDYLSAAQKKKALNEPKKTISKKDW